MQAREQLVESPARAALRRCVQASKSGLFYIVTSLTIAAIPVLAKMSQSDGGYRYSSFVMVMCTEVGKLGISVYQYFTAVRRDQGAAFQPSRGEFGWILVPSIVYAVANNLQMLVMTVMDPSTFRVLQNFKIVTTALLWRTVMGQTLRSNQWIAMCFLTVGSLSLSAPSSPSNGAANGAGGVGSGTTIVGLLLMVVQCSLSALGSISTEYAFKRKGRNILPVQNIIMYSQGIALNLLMALLSQGLSAAPDAEEDVSGVDTDTAPHNPLANLFAGFTMVVWLLVITRSIVGVLISMIFKHASAVLYTLVSSSAAPVAALMSYFLIGSVLTLQHAASSTVVLLAVYLYNAHKFHDDMMPQPSSAAPAAAAIAALPPPANNLNAAPASTSKVAPLPTATPPSANPEHS